MNNPPIDPALLREASWRALYLEDHSVTVGTPRVTRTPRPPYTEILSSWWRFETTVEPLPLPPKAPSGGPIPRKADAIQIPAELLKRLVEVGYLQTLPLCPETGRNHYVLTTWGNGITCLVHGEIQSRQGNDSAPRAQLQSEGITDPQLLAAASPVAWSDWRNRARQREELMLVTMLVALWLVLFGAPAFFSHRSLREQGVNLVRLLLAAGVLGGLLSLRARRSDGLDTWLAILVFVAVGQLSAIVLVGPFRIWWERRRFSGK